MAVARILIGNRFGYVIDEMRAKVGTMSWRINEIGRATLEVSKNNPKATEQNLRHGNRIYVQFPDSDGIPVWAGVLDVPRVWTDSSIKISCYSIEYLLQWRITDKNRGFRQVPVGRMLQHLIEEAQYDQDMGITNGVYWLGGRLLTTNYHFKSVWTIIQNDILKTEGADIEFVPSIREGRIIFTANLHETLGIDKSTRRAFVEGVNVSMAELTEQGPLVNEWAMAGGGTTWGDSRPSIVISSFESADAFGLRQSSKIHSNVSQAGTLERYALTELEDTAYTRTRIRLTVTNDEPALYSEYHIGDRILVRLPTYEFDGYEASCRILSREYNPQDGSSSLVLEEVEEVFPTYGGLGGKFTDG